MIPAIREARRRSRSPVPTSAPGFCKREVRECLSLNVGHVIVSRSGSAAEAWENAKRKHRTDDPADIPRGATPFWLGGSEGNGHVSLGVGAGGHWTTDVVRPGFFDRTGIARVSRSFSSSLRLVGWVEDFDDVDIWRDGKPVIAGAAARRTFVASLGAFEEDAGKALFRAVDPVVPDDEASAGYYWSIVEGRWTRD